MSLVSFSRLFFCGLILSSVSVFAAEGFNFFRRNQQGDLLVPVVEMTDRSNRKVLLVGVSHYAPKSFYKTVHRVVQDWSSKRNGQTHILQEFFTCRGSTLASVRESFDEERFQNFKLNPGLADLDQFLQKDDVYLDQVIAAYHLKEQACELDVDGRTMRPSYYVKRNQNLCQQGDKEGFSCQWKELRFQDSGNVRVLNGDLDMDTASKAIRILGAITFLGLEEENWPVKNHGFIVGIRDYLLIGQMQKSFEKGAMNVVLPWGAAHLSYQYAILQSMGFKETSFSEIKVMGGKDLGRSEILDENYNATENAPYGFEPFRQ